MHYLEIVVRPLAAVVLFGGAALLAWWLKRFIPDGVMRRALYKRYPLAPQTEAERKDWMPVLLIFAAIAAEFAIIGLL